MNLSQEPVFLWLSQYAYQPEMVYGGVVLMMLLSAFGLPVPEEVSLVSVGLLAFMGSKPDIFPPPYPGAAVVNVHLAALISFLAVYSADTLVYGIGRKYGRKILYHRRLGRVFSPTMLQRVEEWTAKYGAYACGIFRFTPGIRFPGHLACGMLKFPFWKFLTIDGIAAAISVPTQIYLLALFGEPILVQLKEFKIVIFSLLAAGAVFLLLKKFVFKRPPSVV